MANKKGQLGIIEFKFWIIGFIMGLVIMAVLVALLNMGVVDFSLPLLSCPKP
jgi:hypothetical protein